MIAGRALEVVDGLEQRHDRQGAALDPGRVGEEPGGLGQQVGAEHVAHAPGHAQHEGAERLAVDLLAQRAHQREHAERLRGVRRAAPAAAAPGVSGRASSPASQAAPRLGVGPAARRRRSPRACRAAERGVELGGVLPDVEPDGAEAERLHLAPHRPHQRRRRARGAPASTSSASISRRSATSASAEA